MVDLYSILGVRRDADEAEIKRAYRRLAVRYHPDSGGDQADAEKFIKVNKAYEVLSHPRRRWWYDNQYVQGYTVRSRTGGQAARRQASRARYVRRKPPKAKKIRPLYKRLDFQLYAGSLLFIMAMAYYSHKIRLVIIKRHDTYTTARIFSASAGVVSGKNLNYTYTVGDSLYRYHEARPTPLGSNTIYNSMGIPIRREYQFKLWYNPENPHRVVIDLDKPTAKGMMKMKRDAFKELARQEDIPIYQAGCMVNDLYEHMGPKVLGIIMSRDLKWFQNLRYNRHRYSRLKESELYKDIKEDCSRLLIIP